MSIAVFVVFSVLFILLTKSDKALRRLCLSMLTLLHITDRHNCKFVFSCRKIRNACSEEAERPLNAVDKDGKLKLR